MWRTSALRLYRAFTTLPTRTQWGEAALWLAIIAAGAIPVGLASGTLKYAPTSDGILSIAVFAAVAFIVPSLFEETLFRALLLPHATERRSRTWLFVNTIAAVMLFVFGHVAVAWLFVSSARSLFYDPTFLSLSAIFGVVSSVVYLRSGSIWPSVVMHWLIVVAWKIWFGGWIMLYR